MGMTTQPPELTTASRSGRWVIKATWLTRKPTPESALVSAACTAALAVGSSLYWSKRFGVSEWMPASPEAVFTKHEYWRLWTTLFAHGDLGHLASNSFLFFILGFFLYGYFGPLLYPVSALIWGGVANLIVLATYDPDTQLIGASGVVYWMGGCWLVLYFFLSRQKNLAHRWIRTLGVGLLLFMPSEAFEVQVSYRAHFVGFILGLLAGTWHYLRRRALFHSAEVREFEFDDIDPEDDLPPPEGLPVELDGNRKRDGEGTDS